MFHSARYNLGSQSVELEEYLLKDWPFASGGDVDKHPCQHAHGFLDSVLQNQGLGQLDCTEPLRPRLPLRGSVGYYLVCRKPRAPHQMIMAPMFFKGAKMAERAPTTTLASPRSTFRH